MTRWFREKRPDEQAVKEYILRYPWHPDEQTVVVEFTIDYEAAFLVWQSEGYVEEIISAALREDE